MGTTGSQIHAARVSQAELVRSRVREALHGHPGPVAVIDFPNHNNAGDSAIWLGEQAALRYLGVEIAYVADRTSFLPERVRRAVGDGPVLMHGGGNFGDVWPDFQELRERVLTTLPSNPVIQLPQTITFENVRNQDRVARVCRAHGGMTLLVRDHESLAIARDVLEVPTHLCPDMAMALEGINLPVPPVVDVLWQARMDKESDATEETIRTAIAQLRGSGTVELADWSLEDRKTRWARQSLRILGRVTRYEQLAAVPVQDIQATPFTRFAGQRVAMACRLLSRGRVVVTDRLHGHILCTLMGIPHLLLDNNNGKVGNYFRVWNADTGLTEWAGDVESGVKQARALLAQLREESRTTR